MPLVKHLVPVKEKMTDEEFIWITQEDNYPRLSDIKKTYVELCMTKGFDFRCGDIIQIKSTDQQYDKYYFIARDGLELIEDGERDENRRRNRKRSN